jgi:hypothetical protein
MQYFMLMPDDTEQDAMFDSNLLGEGSFSTFWAGGAFVKFVKIVETELEHINHIRIMTDRGKQLSVEDFVNELKNYKYIKTR